ncbi:MAG: DUF4105 domain-containing protein [Oligoflexales bacterium]
MISMIIKLYGLFFLFSGTLQAQLLEVCNFTDHPKVQLSIREIEQRSPVVLVQSLPKNLKVCFKKFNKKERVTHTLGAYQPKKNKIYLSKSLLTGDVDGVSLMRVLWHELAHVYDHQHRASRNLDFLYLSHWRRSLFGFQASNELLKYTFDPYQNSSPEEGFAVGFEAFMEDSEFVIRRPNLYQFFRKEFDIEPFPKNRNYFPETTVTLRRGLTQIEPFILEKSRFYGADYLYATPGSSQSSRWGHSMLRLIFCRPGREPSEQCRKDLNHHLVVSFRADPGFSLVTPLLGIFGGYPSRIFMMSLSQIIQEYTRGSARELRSYPLHFNDEEKERFLTAVQETYWSYRGRYWFVTNNCATETLRLLKMTFQNNRFYKKRIVTPKGLYKALRSENKVSQGLFKDRTVAIQKSYLFPSIAPDIDWAMDAMSYAQAHKKRKKYLKNYSFQKRKDFYEKYTFTDRAEVTRFMKLEEWVGEQKHKKLKDQVLRKNSSLLFLKNIYKTVESVSSEHLRSSGYGIPMFKDFSLSEKKYEDLAQVLEKQKTEYEVQVRKDFPNIVRELEGAEKNKNFLVEKLSFFLKRPLQIK